MNHLIFVTKFFFNCAKKPFSRIKGFTKIFLFEKINSFTIVFFFEKIKVFTNVFFFEKIKALIKVFISLGSKIPFTVNLSIIFEFDILSEKRGKIYVTFKFTNFCLMLVKFFMSRKFIKKTQIKFCSISISLSIGFSKYKQL